MTAAIDALLAHQGGWDEVLMALVPLVVVGGLLVLANRRAKQSLARGSTPERDHPVEPH